MGLQVWLPLTEDTRNQGLSNVTVMNNGATFNSAGKLGGCYYFNRASSNYLKIDNPIATATNGVSMAFWVKLPSNGSVNDQLVHIGNGSGWTNNRFTCFVRGGNSTLIFSCSDGTNSTQYGCTSSSLTLNQWTHVVCIYNSNKLMVYLNGILDKEYNTAIIPSFANVAYIGIGAGPNATEPATTYLNDVRIYDHALSPREVKEISKGLVLHYPLTMPGQENLVTGSNTDSTATNKWLGHSAVGGNTSTIEVDETGTNCVKVTRDSTAQSSWDFLSYDALLRNQLKTNTVYAVSFDAKPSVDGTITLNGFMNGNSTNNMIASVVQVQSNLLANKWNHCVYRCTTLDSFDGITISSQVIYLIRSTSLKGVNTTVLFKNIKVEEGEIDTPWIPNSTDAFYTSLGLNDGIEYDVSGYQHNGTKVGNITYDADTPRYETSTVLDGTYITLAGVTNQTIPQFSICGWVNLLTGYTANYGCHLINFSKTYCRICVSKDNAAVRILLTDDTTNYSGSSVMRSSSLSANVWNHYAVTFDNGSIKIYINGKLDSSITATITSISPSTPWTIGNHGTSEFPKAKVSDVRFYITCLNESDVRELYNTSMSLSNNGVLFGYEFIE